MSSGRGARGGCQAVIDRLLPVSSWWCWYDRALELGLLDEEGVQSVIDKASSELEASNNSTQDQVGQAAACRGRRRTGRQAC